MPVLRWTNIYEFNGPSSHVEQAPREKGYAEKTGSLWRKPMSRHHTPCHQQLYTSQRIYDTVLAGPPTHTLTLNFHFKIIENSSLKKKIIIKNSDTPYCKNPIKNDPVYHSMLMVLHLITDTFYCTLVAHCFDTLCYIFLSMPRVKDYTNLLYSA